MEQMEKSPQLTGRIVNPNDPTYQIDRQQYNTFFNIFPLVIVFAQNTNDISDAVNGPNIIKFQLEYVQVDIIMKVFQKLMLVLLLM